MNHVLVLTHNCLDLARKCVDSVQAQDVPVYILAVDNGSTDGTSQWLPKNDDNMANFVAMRFQNNNGVSKGWNWGLNYLFSHKHADHVLVLNQDTFLPPWFYRRLLACDVPFVTGVSVGSMEEIAEEPPVKELAPCPDFSAFLIRRSCWETVGSFEELLVSYCGDLDYHIRAHLSGVRLWNAGIPFYHERSSTINSAAPKEKRLLQLQADADRSTFQDKWVVSTSGPGYDSLFREELFGANRGTIG